MKPHYNTPYKSSAWFDIMLMMLAGVAGSIDVMSYFRLDHVFTANMTGNTILLGLSIGQGKLSSSLHSLAALAGFIIGALIGAFIVENKKKGWSYYITLSFAVESLIIALLAMIWLQGRPPDGFLLYLAISLSAIAMGMQSATIRHLNIPGVVTTFITGTMTSIGMSAVKGLRQGFTKTDRSLTDEIPVPKTMEQRIELQVMVFFVYLFSAILTGWIEYHGSKFLPLLPLLLILCVLAIAVVHPRNPHLAG